MVHKLYRVGIGSALCKARCKSAIEEVTGSDGVDSTDVRANH